MSEELQSILESLGGARKFADPGSPQSVRLMAASGALPLPPTQISTVLFLLASDADDAVRERAAQSLRDLPERVLDATLTGAVPGALLAQLAELHRESAERLEKIALNAHTSDRTFCFLASLPQPRLIDIVSNNQTRMLRCSELVEALGDNPVTSAATLDRVLEFLGIPRRGNSEPPEAIPVPEPAAGTEAPGSERIDPESLDSIPPDMLEEHKDENPDDAEQRSRSLTVRIGKMNVMQKIKLARFGNAEARSTLVRDRNKIVSAAVMNSPKLGESEVLSYCKNRSTPEEVLRFVANSRDWTKSHAIQYALCIHPKTSVPTAMKFLNHMTDLELKNIMKSKDVAAQVSIHARRLLQKKGKA